MDTQTIDRPNRKETRKLFMTLGSCSQTFFHIINRELGYSKPHEEKASDPFAGGVLRLGHQCGMLWGSAMAVGAAAYQQANTLNRAIQLAIESTKTILDSFIAETKTVNCKEITGTDFKKPLQFLRYMIFRTGRCFGLAGTWAPEVVRVTKKALSTTHKTIADTKSCASEVVREMDGSEEEMSIVAGLAGGIGFSGQACGALGAAIWMNSLAKVRENPKKSVYNNPAAKSIIQSFKNETNGKMLCLDICERRFADVEDHSTYIKEGGCKQLISMLANAARHL